MHGIDAALLHSAGNRNNLFIFVFLFVFDTLKKGMYHPSEQNRIKRSRDENIDRVFPLDFPHRRREKWMENREEINALACRLSKNDARSQIIISFFFGCQSMNLLVHFLVLFRVFHSLNKMTRCDFSSRSRIRQFYCVRLRRTSL